MHVLNTVDVRIQKGTCFINTLRNAKDSSQNLYSAGNLGFMKVHA